MNCDNISAAAFLRRLTSKAVMAFEQTLKKDWYSILGADPSAHVSDLKQKYQKLILLVSLFFFFQIGNHGGQKFCFVFNIAKNLSFKTSM